MDVDNHGAGPMTLVHVGGKKVCAFEGMLLIAHLWRASGKGRKLGNKMLN
jgi:hypothetical protein